MFRNVTNCVRSDRAEEHQFKDNLSFHREQLQGHRIEEDSQRALPPTSELTGAWECTHARSTRQVHPTALSFFLLLLQGIIYQCNLPCSQSCSATNQQRLCHLRARRGWTPGRHGYRPGPRCTKSSKVSQATRVYLTGHQWLFIASCCLFQLCKQRTVRPRPGPLHRVSRVFRVINQEAQCQLSFSRLYGPSCGNGSLTVRWGPTQGRFTSTQPYQPQGSRCLPQRFQRRNGRQNNGDFMVNRR